MVKPFFLQLQNKPQNVAADLLGSRLSRQITAWVFFSIVAIESVIFVPSYGRRQAEELGKLETISQEVLTTVKAEIMSDMPEQMLLSGITLNSNSLIKGVALYNAEGQQLDSVGEVPVFEASTFTNPVSHRIWSKYLPQFLVGERAASATKMAPVKKRSVEGTRYDVAWPSPTAPYMLAIRHDATVVQRTMRRYVIGVTILVIIISAFVTLVTLLVQIGRAS